MSGLSRKGRPLDLHRHLPPAVQHPQQPGDAEEAPGADEIEDDLDRQAARNAGDLVHANMATARIGLALPPRMRSGKPMKVNRPRPISVARLSRHSIWVMPRSAQAMCAWKFCSPSGAGEIASDAEHADALVGQPVDGGQRQAREVVQVAGAAEQPLIRRHPDQHGVARGDALARGGDGGPGLLQRRRGPECHMAEIDAEGGGVEVGERHLVHARRPRPRVEMHRGIDMGAGVVAHGQEHRFAGEGGVPRALGLVMVVPPPSSPSADGLGGSGCGGTAHARDRRIQACPVVQIPFRGASHM